MLDRVFYQWLQEQVWYKIVKIGGGDLILNLQSSFKTGALDFDIALNEINLRAESYFLLDCVFERKSSLFSYMSELIACKVLKRKWGYNCMRKPDNCACTNCVSSNEERSLPSWYFL